ncbi:hypothetical protein ACQPX6_06190 [Actinomycetospora sp. CA-101289]|uniref:hypothetical protein n=1 Tax=Actinomycetospora sp. CA-101289 TaxID=3239893 RepID=UPI003D96E9C5
MSPPAPSPYRILGVTSAASPDEVRRAYARALKERRHPREQITAAFNRLRDPRRRLAQDLRELDVGGLLARLREQVAAEAAAPLVDDASTPVPSWSALVDPDAAGWDPPAADVPAPRAEYRSARLLEPPPAAALPIPEFRLP